MRTHRRDADLLAALTLLIASVIVVEASAPLALRVPITLAFLGLAPGTGWVRLIGLRSPMQELGAVFAVSIASDILISQLITSLDTFQTRPVVAILGAWTVAGLLVCYASRDRAARADRTDRVAVSA